MGKLKIEQRRMRKELIEYEKQKHQSYFFIN